MSEDISHDPIYRAVRPDDFRAMVAAERYGQRSDSFDPLISATHDHFWDPLDARYVDYSLPFDLERELVLPLEMFPEFRVPAVQRLSPPEKVRLANENSRWIISGLLHGEQAAMSLCANLCGILVDPGAQEYASNQAREEARHVTAFGRYVGARWGTPYEIGDSLGTLLTELVQAPEVYKKLIGMQILVEGLAMGMFAVIHLLTKDPLLRRVTQLVMMDETFHHKFGKTWAQKTMPKVSPEEHARVEDWAAHCFEKLLLNLVNIRERREVYRRFDLDWEELRDSCEAYYGESARRGQLQQQGNVFRVIAASLSKANVVTGRTRPIYERWLSLDEATRETDSLDVVGEVVFSQGISYLTEINRERRSTLGRRENAVTSPEVPSPSPKS